MVDISIRYPQIIFLLLVFAAIIIFLLSKYLHLSNTMMALTSALIFLIILLLIIFKDEIFSIFTFAETLLEQNSNYQNSRGYLYQDDPGASLISSIALVLAILVSFYSGEYLNLDHKQQTFYPLLQLMICGFIGMLFASNLMVLYLFSELMGLCTYTLVAFRRRTDTAIEAGFKYLMMGSVASIMILLGITLLFFTFGTINISEIQITDGWISQTGTLLIISGLCLKSAFVPLHTWLPDAHGRAPSSISAILSGIMVQGVFYVMVRLSLSLGFNPTLLGTILLVLSLLNILVGNLLGLVQNHTKRLLGYSTISQMGYIGLCMAIGLRNNLLVAIQTSFFIMIVHAFSKSLAFLSKGVLHYYLNATKIKDLERSSEMPGSFSLKFGLAIISLAAIPPFAGFTGKWMTLTSLITSSDELTSLCIIIFLTGSLIALGYYLPILIYIFPKLRSRAAKLDGEVKKISCWMNLPISILALSILYISLTPKSSFHMAEEAALFLMDMMR